MGLTTFWCILLLDIRGFFMDIVDKELEKFQIFLTTSQADSKIKSPKTVATYLSIVKNFLEWLIKVERLRVVDMRRQHIPDFINYKATNNRFNAKELSKSTLNTYTASLTTYMRFKGHNIKTLAYQTIGRTKEHSPTVKQIDTIKYYAKSGTKDPILALRNSLLVEFAYQTGFRVAEIATAKTTDLNFKTGAIDASTKAEAYQKAKLQKEWIDEFKQYLGMRGVKVDDEQPHFLFVTKTDRGFDPPGIWHILKEAGRKAGIENPDTGRYYGPHDMRASNITHCILAGESVASVKERVGHKSPATTALYVRKAGIETMTNPRDKKKELEKLM